MSKYFKYSKQYAVYMNIKKNYIYIKKHDDKNNYKFRHHSHYTGKCRSAAHGICSLSYIIPKENPKIL